jgi:hypothetical protein
MESSLLFDRIDLRRLRRDVASASAEARALKRILRRRWERPMADEQRALARVAWRLTELCVLLARRRGRWHVTAPPRDVRQAGAAWDRDTYHAKIAERVALDYRLTEEATGAPAPSEPPGGKLAPAAAS